MEESMKKIIALIISAALIAAIAIGGTLAYLTSNANDTPLHNTFVSDPVLLDINLDEAPVDAITGRVIPGARRTQNEYPIIPGEVMSKDPTITVVGGSQPCYVFAYISNTAKVTATAVGASAKSVVSVININTAVWDEVAAGLFVYSQIDPVTHELTPLVVNKMASNQVLTPVFTEITINPALLTEDVNGLKSGELNVQAFAHQANGNVDFADVLTQAKAQFGIA